MRRYTMNDYHKKAEAVLQQVNQVILGKEQETAEIFLAFLADGHVLLEDIPGSVFCNLLLADEINRTSPKTQ